jgi:hypothetical protein
MNHPRRLIGLLVVVWSVLLAGCSTDQTKSAAPSTSSSATTTPPPAPTGSSEPASLQISKDREFSKSTTTFGRRDTVYIKATLGPGVDLSDSAFVWYGNTTGPQTADLRTHETVVDPVPPETHRSIYELSSPSGWEAGTYSVVMRLHHQPAASVEFTIE